MKETVKKIIEKGIRNCGNLECDGTTKVLHYLLTQEAIAHKVFIGNVESIEGTILVAFHHWITIRNFSVDYKLPARLGADRPYGIFKQSHFPI